MYVNNTYLVSQPKRMAAMQDAVGCFSHFGKIWYVLEIINFEPKC